MDNMATPDPEKVPGATVPLVINVDEILILVPDVPGTVKVLPAEPLALLTFSCDRKLPSLRRLTISPPLLALAVTFTVACRLQVTRFATDLTFPLTSSAFKTPCGKSILPSMEHETGGGSGITGGGGVMNPLVPLPIREPA